VSALLSDIAAGGTTTIDQFIGTKVCTNRQCW
jgi:hypothetical protein